MENPCQTDVNMRIIQKILNVRRKYTNLSTDVHMKEDESKIYLNQINKIKFYTDNQLPIECVLPAFPMKSPNPNKVLGRLPDMAERLSLSFLNDFCEEIKQIYPAGAKIIICSDGRVFGDVVKVSDTDITNYQDGLAMMIDEIGAVHLETFNLEDSEVCQKIGHDYDRMRQCLVQDYAESLDAIKQRLTQDESGVALYRAMSRFLFEDGLMPDYVGSRSALQKDAKSRAVEVIQRSWAWGNFLKHQFPHAIRFSIHPQPAESMKIGIHMMPTQDNWLTPWHGVAVDIGDRFVLMKRSEAIELKAQVIHDNHQQSHYKVL